MIQIKAKIFVMTTIILIVIATGCTMNANETNYEKVKIEGNTEEKDNAANEVDDNSDIESVIEDMYKKIYIGEIFTSGDIYIEPFSIDRDVLNQEIEFTDYPSTIQFYLIEASGINTYSAAYDSQISFYVPEKEKASLYFNQGFSSPIQYGLCYKSDESPSKSSIGISLFDHEIAESNFSVKGEKRPYTESEHEAALAQVKKDQEIEDSYRILEALDINDTIIGAEQICIMRIKDLNIEIMISQYITHSFEYVSKVYVIDFIRDGKILKTYEKYNTDGPY